MYKGKMEIKLRDLVTIARNKTNKQTNFTLKKRKLRDIDVTEDELLALKINKKVF